MLLPHTAARAPQPTRLHPTATPRWSPSTQRRPSGLRSHRRELLAPEPRHGGEERDESEAHADPEREAEAAGQRLGPRDTTVEKVIRPRGRDRRQDREA